MNAQLKFGLITVVIVGALGWLAVQGIGESATYYVTLEELAAMPEHGDKRIRVGGDVKPDSIKRSGDQVEFVITQKDEGMTEEKLLPVIYVGSDPLPDTFRDRAQALCDGKMRADGVFEAKKIQAKCASKYEAKPGEGVSPTYDTVPAEAPSATDD